MIVVDDDSRRRRQRDWRQTGVRAAARRGRQPTADFPGRTSDDLYIACTGGTTGMPKGVVWRHEDVFFATMGGGDPTTLEGPITSPEQLADRVLDPGISAIITPPLMHVSAHWGAFKMLLRRRQGRAAAGRLVRPEEVWRLVERRRPT